MFGIRAPHLVELLLRRPDPHPSIATAALRWIEPHSAKPRLKFLGVCLFGKAEDALPLVRYDDRVPSRAQGQVCAKFCDDIVLLTQTFVGR
jgi:hypothetical protein